MTAAYFPPGTKVTASGSTVIYLVLAHGQRLGGWLHHLMPINGGVHIQRFGEDLEQLEPAAVPVLPLRRAPPQLRIIEGGRA